MSKTGWVDVAAVALAVAVLAGLGFVFRPVDTPTVRVSPSSVHVDRAQPSADPRPSVLFIGDSYTAGNGLPEMSYGCMAAARMGWVCDLSAMPGTGYISGGPANRFVVNQYAGTSKSFAERIPQLAQKYSPDVVILDGGRDDTFPPTEYVFKAMVATIEEARSAWPQATIVFIRPRFLGKPNDDLGFDDAFMARLQEEAGAAEVVLVDPIKTTFSDSNTLNMLKKDGIHPNTLGEQELASALLSSLIVTRFVHPA
jgi:lysophospholipase L1-like esterase